MRFPCLEGEGRREAAGWGDGLSSRKVPVLRDHPAPSRILRCVPTLPLQGPPGEGWGRARIYSPNTIFATISRWISDEPPKIV
ncbi:hypothetical protein V1277_001802 [Bradyrhizobium sp. AZCC 1588]